MVQSVQNQPYNLLQKINDRPRACSSIRHRPHVPLISPSMRGHLTRHTHLMPQLTSTRVPNPRLVRKTAVHAPLQQLALAPRTRAHTGRSRILPPRPGHVNFLSVHVRWLALVQLLAQFLDLVLQSVRERAFLILVVVFGEKNKGRDAKNDNPCQRPC